MKRKITAVLAAALSLTLVACTNPKEFSDDEAMIKKYTRSDDVSVTYNYADGAEEPPAAYNSYANAVSAFSFKELAALAAVKKESFVCSPASSALQLGMLGNGASGNTRQDILLAFGAEFSLGDFNACSSYFKSRMESVSKAGLKKDEKPDEFVSLQGAMLLDEGTDVKSAFLQSAADFYGFDVFRFAFDGENAQNKLKNYLKGSYPYDELPLSDGDINMVNAPQISDVWLQGNDAESNDGAFKGASGSRSESFFRANEIKIKSENAVGVIKYTAQNPLKLVLILPDEGLAPADYLQQLDSTKYNSLINSADVTKRCTAVIPKISIEADDSAQALSAVLSHCGLSAIFGGGASFSAMSYHSDAKLGEIFELQNDFSMDENGVNTDSESDDTASFSEMEDKISFDRPFIFMLVDNETNIPVQAGIFQ